MLKEQIKNKIEDIISDKIVISSPLGGGCINDAQMLKTQSGKKFFIKTNSYLPSDTFIKEAHGLMEIASSKSIKVPEVIAVDNDFILLEFIITGNRIKNFFEKFGRKFAEMHKYYSNDFGFYEDNYIGSNPQINIAENEEKNNWVKFYFNKRLLYQIRLAEKNGYLTPELNKAFLLLENKIESIYNGHKVKPSLLHGDLWGGNYMIDQNGEACLIDPAVYYGDREADLAMTKLFGGFGYEFYQAYNEAYPLDAGYEFRENIYKLYHILNHLNLFGTGYYRQALELIKFYI